MAHEYVLRFETPGDRAVALDILQRVVCLGEKVFDVQIDGGKQLYLGSRLQIDVPSDAVVYVEGSSGNCKPFYDIFYLIDERKSGCHDPEGLLWFKVGRPKVHSQRVSILDIFPTVLEFMGIEYRPSEGIPFAGRSLVMDWNGT